ncbi:MAG: hypothetical protein SV487_02235, partial [Thermodesulfobacteriota bacterium]|nr:hypothetical protein [Thermodesulfobacteriota bacterium]
MNGDFGYFEGEELGKPYDLKLMGRLLHYARPYAFLLAVTSVLILGATAADLVLPYLTKIAVDRHIVVNFQEVRLTPGSGPRAARLVESSRCLMRSTGREGVFFL